MKKHDTHNLEHFEDVLPIKEHYWLLHDGETYARHGTVELNGLLVFTCQERAEQFCLTVGKGLPSFKPVKVSADRFLAKVLETGAFCLAQGLSLTIITLSAKEATK